MPKRMTTVGAPHPDEALAAERAKAAAQERQLLKAQQAAAEKRLECSKVLGEHNPADLMTAYLTADVIQAHCGYLRLNSKDGRAETAPTLNGLIAFWGG